MNKKLIWLDDSRNPFENDWLIFSPIDKSNIEVYWLISYQEFVQWITDHGLPDGICFDHDLGTEKTGYDAAKWLCNYCEEHKLLVPPYGMQSSNPVGRENIDSYIKNFVYWIDK